MKKAYLHICLITTVLFIAGCNPYQIKNNQLTRKFTSAGLSSNELRIGDTTIHYWAGGSGKPLLLLHGFGASAKFQWDRQVDFLADTCRMIIPDLVYFGESRSTGKNYSVEFQAKMMMKLMDHLKIQKFDCIGLSYGGLVAITIADRYPGRVDRLIISDSPIKYYTSADNRRALDKYQAKTIQELLVPRKPEDIPRLLEIAYYKPPWAPGFILKNIHQNMFSNQPDEKGSLLKYLQDNEKTLTAKKYVIKGDILLIWGRHDFLIPPQTGTRLKEHLGARARLVIIEKAAHMPNMERPAEFNRVLKDFLIK